jgi:hypothetical protein
VTSAASGTKDVHLFFFFVTKTCRSSDVLKEQFIFITYTNLIQTMEANVVQHIYNTQLRFKYCVIIMAVGYSKQKISKEDRGRKEVQAISERYPIHYLNQRIHKNK